MNGYVARAVPWEHGWELHVEGVGVTQVRVLSKAEQQVRDLVATVRGVPVPAETPVQVNLDLGGLERQVAQAQQGAAEAARIQAEAAQALREIVARLRRDGISVSDIATILGRSRGRVSQLLT